MSATSSPSPTNSDFDALKRKFSLLEAQHAVVQERGSKSISASQVSMGCALRHTVHMFTSARDLVSESDRRLDLAVDGDQQSSTPEEDKLFRSYMELIKRVPLVKHLVEQGEAEALKTLYRNLRKGSDMARGDDSCKLKVASIDWVNNMYGPSQPKLRANSKYERGFDNNHTGRLLCPGEYSWDTPSVRNSIRQGHTDYLVTAHSWPMFLYANYICDANNVEKGLFRSSILVKAYKHLFTSPSSVSEDDTEGTDKAPPAKRAKNALTATRQNVASLIALSTVTPRSIAYVAVQLRFLLSNATSWRVIDIDFNNVEFYAAIVDFFEETPGPRTQAKVDELLAWWNKQIFGRESGVSRHAHHHAGSSISRMAAQRKAFEEASLDG